jgi:hypothetical protein
MAAIAPVVLANGAASPVNKTFDPVNIINDVANFADRSSGISLGYPSISLSVRPPVSGAKTRNNKVTFKVITPILEVTSPSTATGIQPAPTKAYDLVFDGSFILPERCSLAERKDILAFAKNALGHAMLQNAVWNLEPVY